MLFSSQLFAEDKSDIFYITEQEVKVGFELNLLNEFAICQKSLTQKKAGCCLDGSEFMELGKVIKYKDIEFKCVALESKDMPETIDPNIRNFLTKYEWIANDIVNHCSSINLPLNECKKKIQLK